MISGIHLTNMRVAYTSVDEYNIRVTTSLTGLYSCVTVATRTRSVRYDVPSTTLT